MISLAASAQTATPASSNSGRTRYSEPKFRMGLHLLPSVAWLDVRDTHSNSEGSVVRFGFGFTADIMFADNYAVGTGLNVFRNGGKVSHYDRVLGDPEDAANDSTAFLVRRERTLTQHWEEVPISFKFRTRQIGHITYWGQFGMGLGLNLRSTAKDAMDYRYRGEEGEEGARMPVSTVTGGRRRRRRMGSRRRRRRWMMQATCEVKELTGGEVGRAGCGEGGWSAVAGVG